MYRAASAAVTKATQKLYHLIVCGSSDRRYSFCEESRSKGQAQVADKWESTIYVVH